MGQLPSAVVMNGIIWIFCLSSGVILSEFAGVDYKLLLAAQQQQQHLQLQEIENNVTITIKQDEERGNYTSRMSDTPVVRGGEDADPVARARRNFVKGMMKHAWNGYEAHAWGKNEVKPVSKSGNSATVFGSSEAGATIVDSMTTLYIMEMDEEFIKAKEWVADNLDLARLMKYEVNIFEINIRYVGGLVSLFALTGDEIFKDRAKEIVDKLLPAFDTPIGIPLGMIHLKTGLTRERRMSILSEFGTMHMEFSYLTDITGNNTYKEKVEAIREYLNKKDKPKGLYPNQINPTTGQWGQDHSSLGAHGDSFYEYLLKEWIRSGKSDELSKEMFDEAISNVEEILLQNSSHGQTYFADRRGGMLAHKMDHLACFTGGMFSLAAVNDNDEVKKKWMNIAEEITRTCHESYENTVTKLGPEIIRFDKFLNPFDRSFLLRPETVESYFVLWRLTKDPKYREWGWQVVQALELNCKVEGGYSGLRDVNILKSYDDVQQSFFLAETLKYLYLLFSSDSLLDLDLWVFNTEAHPLPIKGVNPFYRELRYSRNTSYTIGQIPRVEL